MARKRTAKADTDEIKTQTPGEVSAAEDAQAPSEVSAAEDETTMEKFMPYDAVVSPALLVFRHTPDGPVVGTLTKGTKVHVVERASKYALLENGIYVKEALLEAQ